MSILNECEYQDITDFAGPNLLVDEEDVTEPQALAARNCEYVEGQVRTRRGFVQVWNPAKIVRVMYNWVQQAFNQLIYLNSDNNLIQRSVSSGSEATILSSITAAGMTFAQAGYRLYMAFFDTSGNGLNYTKVWDGSNVTPQNVFQPTYQTTDLSGGSAWATFSEPGVGTVTAGKHYFMLVPTTYSGFQTAPGPQLSGVNVPNSFTAAGNKTLQIQASPATVWTSCPIRYNWL